MNPLCELSKVTVENLCGIVFDLDDTFLSEGQLSKVAYNALWRLKENGFQAIACTGRPAGWGRILAKQWPVDAMITENGAFACSYSGQTMMEETLGTSREQRGSLRVIGNELLEMCPEATWADDNWARQIDATIDIGEHCHVEQGMVEKMKSVARSRGVRVFSSSVHLHLTHSIHDKATGTIAYLSKRYGLDSTSVRYRYAFVGDSENDASAFAAFKTTLGVANVYKYVARLSVPPQYIASQERGAGFAEIVERLISLKTV